MTRIDFYLLQNNDSADAKMLLACKLADKAYRQGRQVYMLAPDAATAQHLDDLLWTFNPGSFVPHDLYRSETTAASPVLIGALPPPTTAHEILISLGTDTVPEFFSRFERLIELVGDDEADKARSRARFRFYRDRGYPLETHPL